MKSTLRLNPGQYIRLVLAGIFLVVLQTVSAFAATITSTTSGGNWNVGSTWVGGSAPAVGDLVIIATTSGNSVTLAANHTCVSLTINSGAILNLSSFTLTVNGPWLNNGTFNDGTGTVTFGTANAAINAGTGSANFENIIIASGATLNMNTNVVVNGNFDFVLPAANNIVNINSTHSLSIAGNLTMILPTATRSSTMAVGAGSLTVDGLFNMQAQATSGRANVITISTGTANLNGGYSTGTTAPTIAAGCKITFTDAGTLNLSGTLSGGAPALIQSTGTVNFKGNTAQGIWLETYYNLGVFDGTKSLLGAVTVQNQLNLASGTLQAGAFNITLSGSGDAFLCTGIFDPGTALVTMSGPAATTIPGITFNNLTISSNGLKTVADGTTLTVNGNWAHNCPAALDGSANAVVYGLLSGYGAFSMGSGTLSLDSTYSSSGVLTVGTGTVKYVGGGTIRGNMTYYNLEVDGDRSLAAAAIVSNIVTVNNGRTLSMITRNLTLNGGGNPIVNNGTITSTSGALTFAGTDPQVIASGTYPRTTLSNGTKTIAAGTNVNITGPFLVNAPLNMEGDGSAVITGAASGTGAITMESGTLSFVSTFAGGTFTAGTGKVIYAGTAAQVVRVGIDYYDLELSSSVSNSIASTTMAIANNLIINATTTTTTSTTLNIGNNVMGTGDFGATGFINLAGDWQHTGTLTPGTGTIHYNGIDQLVKNLSYYKLSMTGGTKTLEGNTTATNLVTINAATTLNLNAFTLDLQGGTVNALVNSGTFSGNGKVRYSAVGAQTVNTSTFYDLEFTGGTKTIATGNNIEVTNDWTVSASTLMTSTQNATVGRDLIHNTGALIDQGSGTIRIGRDWLANGGTFDRGTGTVIYEGGNQTIAPFTYAALICSGTGTKTITGDIDISGTLTINSGVTFDRSTYTVTLSFNGTPLVIDGTLTGNGKFIYSGTGTQNIAATSYYDLEFSGSTKNLPSDFAVEILNNWIVGATTVFGNNTIVNLSGDISGAGTFTMNNGILNLGGAWNKTGTFTPGTGTINYNGSTQTIASLAYYNLQVSNSEVKTLAGTTTVSNVLTVNNPASLALSSFTLNLPLSGAPFINTGTILPGTSTVNYTGTAETSIAPGNFFNLNGSGGDRILPDGEEVGIAGAFTPGAGAYTITGSVVNFNGSGPQIIPAFTFNNLILSGSGEKEIPGSTEVTVSTIEIQDGPTLEILDDAQLNVID
ncbi:MAG: hypothetical protein Q8S11_09605 [Daejeonella sp.]|uniref:beta strand repeat-containing protein n=1 Tax=Daejeonella sp. TaxID=2805397 RepID=UPI0027344346|nr:hypothetical protein [Daejeonella sp.]MDP3468576.1 hypothetical protein [Daejeonella sp.]